MSQVVVLAGGLATRMRPMTERIPKILLPIAGVAFLDLLLDRFAVSGVDDVLLLTGHLGDAVDAHLAALSPRGARVRTRSDGTRLLGTAGALRAALDALDERFVVTYGDSYLEFDYLAPLRALAGNASALGCMAVYENRDRLEPSNARVEAGRVVEYDKARVNASRLHHIDYGATALSRDVVASLPADDVRQLSEVQAELAASGRLLALEVGDRFFEIGSPAGLSDLEAHLTRVGGPR